MQCFMGNRVLLSILMGMIAIAMLVSLIHAIKKDSKEKIIGSSVVLGFSFIAVLCLFIFRNLAR